MPPKAKNRGRAAPFGTPPRVGPETLANTQLTRVGKRGVQGGKAPMAGGMGSVPPQIQKRERAAHISNPAASGTQDAGKPSANGGGQTGGSKGRSPLAGGLGDVPPKTLKGGELPTLATPPRGGPKTPANPQPTGVGKTGSQVSEALWGGLWGCPPIFTPTEVSLFEKGRPSPTFIKAGVEGAQPPPRGLGGCAPKS